MGGGSISIHVFVQIIVITVIFSLISSCLCFYVVQTLCDLNLLHCPVNKTNSQCNLHQERLVKWWDIDCKFSIPWCTDFFIVFFIVLILWSYFYHSQVIWFTVGLFFLRFFDLLCLFINVHILSWLYKWWIRLVI